MTRETLASLRLRAEAAERSLTDFRREVREAAVAHAENEGHCRPGINEVLADLGLDQVTSNWAVYATAYYSRDIRIDVAAVNQDEAEQKARDLIDEGIEDDDHRWQGESEWNDSEVRYSSEEDG